MLRSTGTLKGRTMLTNNDLLDKKHFYFSLQPCKHSAQSLHLSIAICLELSLLDADAIGSYQALIIHHAPWAVHRGLPNFNQGFKLSSPLRPKSPGNRWRSRRPLHPESAFPLAQTTKNENRNFGWHERLPSGRCAAGVWLCIAGSSYTPLAHPGARAGSRR